MGGRKAGYANVLMRYIWSIKFVYHSIIQRPTKN